MNFKKVNATCDMPCWHHPFIEITNGHYNYSITDFIDLLPSRFDPSATRNFRVKNYQSFELGLDHLREDDEYINRSIKTLSQQFDLIILTEYFAESMVLLADLMCIPYEVLWTKRRNSKDYFQEPLNEAQMGIFKTFFKQDFMIYDYFNQTLHGKLNFQMRFVPYQTYFQQKLMHLVIKECSSN